MTLRLNKRLYVLKELQPLEFHNRPKQELGAPTHVTVSWIVMLMKKTDNILSVYDVINHSYSHDVLRKCIIDLIENYPAGNSNCKTNPITGYDAMLYYCATANSKKEKVRSYWKNSLNTESKSFSFLLGCILNYDKEVNLDQVIDWDTAEHLLAIYNGLFYHIDLYPPSTDDDFELLVKNICTIIHMFCIQYLNLYPEHSEYIKKYL